jgi:RNA polymerase sigma-70 factor (ECF subfamily)
MPRVAAEFEKVVLTHAASLLRFARKLVGSNAHADDLVQEALRSAWRHFDQYERGISRRVWLFRILLNVRNREFKRLCSRPRTVSTPRAFPVKSNIVELISAQTAFGLLSEEHRQALLLAVVEGFSVKDLSRLLDVPSGTVVSRLSRARAKLRVLVTRRGAGQS